MIRNAALLVVLYSVLSLLIVATVFGNTLRTELEALEEGGKVRLSEAASRLRLQIDGFRAQANIIADLPDVERSVASRNGAVIADTLENFALTYGALRIDLFTESGLLVGTSAPSLSVPTPSQALMQAAVNERLGFELAFEDGQRVVRLSRKVSPPGIGNDGAAILTIDVAELEFQWPVIPEPVVFFDETLIAFSSNRPELLFLSKGEDPEEAKFNLTKSGDVGGVETFDFVFPDQRQQTVLAPSLAVPHLRLVGQIFLDTAPARETARLRALLAFALALVLGLVAAIALQQRRRFALEAIHSATLEARVEERTAELRTAQDDLVAASKLAALGRLSAGVSHELNQPLAAILNFSQNARKFLGRERPDKVDENLEQISGQVQRITRIIGNLRAFARQEATPKDAVDFGEITRTALELIRADLNAAKITTRTTLPEKPVRILAGRIRLEQVILNLLSNAADAMAHSPRKELVLDMRVEKPNVVLTVQDSGSGIDDPDSVFEPFYTTKDLGASKGLGMGLALSFGIVSRFGGALTCRNLDQGAEFRISLPLLEDTNA